MESKGGSRGQKREARAVAADAIFGWGARIFSGTPLTMGPLSAAKAPSPFFPYIDWLRLAT